MYAIIRQNQKRLKDEFAYRIDKDICHGKPTVRGMRYPVENILELLSSSMSIEEILEDYKDLEREDILASLEFATKFS